MACKWVARLLGAALALAAIAAPALAKDFVYMGGMHKVVIVDGDTDEVTGEIPIKGYPIYLVPDNDTRRMYVVAGSRQLIFVIDLDQQKVVDTLSFSVPGQKVAHIYGLVVDGKANRLYAAIQPTVLQMEDITYEAPYIAVVDLTNKKALARIKVPTGISMLAWGKDHKTLLALGHDIYTVDTESLRITETTPVAHPADTSRGTTLLITEWFHPETAKGLGAIVYSTVDPITSLEQTGLLMVDTTTGAVDFLDLGPPPKLAYHFSAVVSTDRKQAYMVFNNISVVDLQRRKITDVVDLSESYYASTLSSDGRKLYCSGGGASFAVFDTVTHKVLKRVLLPADVWDLIVVPAPASAPTIRH